MPSIRAFLIDDEPLAVKRLQRLLAEDGRIEVSGTATDPVYAIDQVRAAEPDVLFLDIEMPGLNGFEFLHRLASQPLVVFTTAYNQYALRAFDVNSVDYLLKPVEPHYLERAIGKLERILGGKEQRPELNQLLQQLAAVMEKKPSFPSRLPSRTGDHVQFIELARVTHIYAKDKLTYAATPKRDFPVDQTIAELETRLDPARFIRIHRSTLVNIDHVQELYTWFGGKMLVRLKDEKQTELSVARDRVKELKDLLGV